MAPENGEPLPDHLDECLLQARAGLQGVVGCDRLDGDHVRLRPEYAPQATLQGALEVGVEIVSRTVGQKERDLPLDEVLQRAQQVRAGAPVVRFRLRRSVAVP